MTKSLGAWAGEALLLEIAGEPHERLEKAIVRRSGMTPREVGQGLGWMKRKGWAAHDEPFVSGRSEVGRPWRLTGMGVIERDAKLARRDFAIAKASPEALK